MLDPTASQKGTYILGVRYPQATLKIRFAKLNQKRHGSKFLKLCIICTSWDALSLLSEKAIAIILVKFKKISPYDLPVLLPILGNRCGQTQNRQVWQFLSGPRNFCNFIPIISLTNTWIFHKINLKLIVNEKLKQWKLNNTSLNSKNSCKSAFYLEKDL